ncbi:radical SAM protein, partial [Archaeoglobales archaeon]
IKKVVNEYKKLKVDEIIVKKMHNWGGELYSIDKSTKKPGICTFPWYALTILWDGSVVLCPQDFYGILEIGNIKENSLFEIWNNEKMKKIRAKMSRRDYKDLKPCNNCDRIWREQFLGVPGEFLTTFLKENILGYKK